MRRSCEFALMMLVAIALTACGSSSIDGTGDSGEKLLPDVALRQVSGPGNSFEYKGPTKIKYQIDITNPFGDPITITRLRLQTMGSGSYTLQGLESPMDQIIGPNKRVTLSFWANGYATGGARKNEAVTIKGQATFTTPTGTVQKMFVQNVYQDFLPGAGE
ncbi:MAG: hypothetical protein JWO56_2335 [Acidobacteria bacterium]|nr:hypothetical protein [Acidobacteriota bacterium]